MGQIWDEAKGVVIFHNHFRPAKYQILVYVLICFDGYYTNLNLFFSREKPLQESANLPSVVVFAVIFSSGLTAKTNFAVNYKRQRNTDGKQLTLPSTKNLLTAKRTLPSVKKNADSQEHTLPSVIKNIDGISHSLSVVADGKCPLCRLPRRKADGKDAP